MGGVAWQNKWPVLQGRGVCSKKCPALSGLGLISAACGRTSLVVPEAASQPKCAGPLHRDVCALGGSDASSPASTKQGPLKKSNINGRTTLRQSGEDRTEMEPFEKCFSCNAEIALFLTFNEPISPLSQPPVCAIIVYSVRANTQCPVENACLGIP